MNLDILDQIKDLFSGLGDIFGGLGKALKSIFKWAGVETGE